MLQVQSLVLPEVKLFTPSVKADHRGDFTDVYKDCAFASAGIAARFVADNHVRNVRANVVRGLHFKSPPFAQCTLIPVTRGRILHVAADLRHGSPRLGRHVAVELCSDRIELLYVPEGFGHAFSVPEDGSEVHYKVSRYRQAAAALGVPWDDPALGIDWRLTGPAILAARDASHPLLATLPSGAAGAMEASYG